jgi:hypothetical protein
VTSTDPVPYVQATRYEISLFPEDSEPRHYFTITVEYRGAGRWAVLDGRYCLGRDGDWEYEPLPSARDEEWLAGHRFDLDTAQQLAKQAAPGLVVNGITAAEAYRRNQPQHVGGRVNAEDCPACHGSNPPWPFICPGPDGADR